jgi:hypothetical protein
MMQINISVNLGNYQHRRLHFQIGCEGADSGQQDFVLNALNNSLITVNDLRVENVQGAPIPFTVTGQQLLFESASPRFRISYEIFVPLRECLGAYQEADLLFPFINEDEIFFGSGALAYPDALPTLADQIEVTFQLEGVPQGWDVFSSMITGGAHPAKLDGFFCYLTPEITPVVVDVPLQEGAVKLRLVGQRGKTFPLNELGAFAARWLTRLDQQIAPYQGAREIDVLFLRTPDDFETQAQGQAFAAGENMLNAILSCGSANPDYLRERFGYEDYEYHLYDGIAHELLHFYTSTAWQARYKSVLCPAVNCPRTDRWLIGESLNVYLHDQYVRAQFGRSFVNDKITPLIQAASAGSARRFQLLDLFLLDDGLRERGTTLEALFGAMVRRKQADYPRLPYDSARWMFDVLRDDLGINAPDLRELVLGETIPDYAALLPAALERYGH